MIVDIQRRLASAAAPLGGVGGSLQQLQAQPTTSDLSSDAIGSEGGGGMSSGGHISHRQQRGHGSSAGVGTAKKEQVKATATAAADFTPIDLHSIGVPSRPSSKPQRDKASGSNSRNSSSNNRNRNVQGGQFECGVAATTDAAIKRVTSSELLTDAYSRQDRRRIRALIKTFDSVASHLRVLLAAASACIPAQHLDSAPERVLADNTSTQASSTSLPLQQSVHSSSSSSSSIGSSSTVGPVRLGMHAPSTVLLLDLGIDERMSHIQSYETNLNIHCPFSAQRGIYFVLEAYQFPSEAALQQFQQLALRRVQQQQRAAAAASADSGGTGSAAGTYKASRSSSSGSGRSAEGSLDLNEELRRIVRKRHRGVGGVLGEGGHFEHLVDAYRAYFHACSYSDTPPTSTSTAASTSASSHRRADVTGSQTKSTTQTRSLSASGGVTACGVRLRLDAFLALVQKYESKQRKMLAALTSRRAGSIQQPTHQGQAGQVGNLSNAILGLRYRTSLCGLLDGATALDVLVFAPKAPAMTADASQSTATAMLDASYRPDIARCAPVLARLRAAGIRAGCSLHQLQGYVAAAVVAHKWGVETVCAYLGIPFLVTLPPSAAPPVGAAATAENRRFSSSNSTDSVTVKVPCALTLFLCSV